MTGGRPHASTAGPVDVSGVSPSPDGSGLVTGAGGEADRALWVLAAGAAGVGTYVMHLPGGELVVDDRVLELVGSDRSSFTGRPEDVYARIHPDDVGEVIAKVERAITTGETYSAEYRVPQPDGGTRWTAARGHTLVDEAGTVTALLGALYDVTELREATTRVSEVLESLAVGYLSMDAGWRVTYVNAAAEHALGRSRADLVGHVMWDLFPATAGTDFEAGYRRAAETGEVVVFDAYYPAPLDAWYEVRATPEHDGVALYFLDITARRRAQERADLLAQVTSELARTLDAEQAAVRLAATLVPALADWCVVTLTRDDRGGGAHVGLRSAGAWHVDPAMRPVAQTWAERRLAALSDDSPVVSAMASGQLQHWHTDATARTRAILRPGPELDLITALAPESVVVVALSGPSGPVGLLSLCNGATRGDFSDHDVATIVEVARRAGLVLDNARLYRGQRDLAEGLQRSLLTDPVQPDHVQIVVRYTPAAQAAQVGGDWYDAFVQEDGATVVAIGDVLGHDTSAAAAMGQVRSLLRGAAVMTGEGPAKVLTRLDRAMRTLDLQTTATAVVARLEQTTDEHQRGITRLRWSNAGHPPVMVIAPDATTTALTAVASDLLLGIDPTTRRRESEVVLDRGATALLYTDGLVERRGESLEVGLARLQDLLEELAAAGATLDELCDEVLARMLPAHPEDDVALLAVRLHPQDRRRPPEAGPNRVPDGIPDQPGAGTAGPDAG